MFDGNKCKVHLKLLVSRFKLLEAKKANLNKQANRAVAGLLREGKSESARIAVEHIIREDFTIEAYEVLRQHIELLLARWAVVQNESEPRKEVQESVCTIIYAGYLLGAEIVELRVLYEQLTVRYGKPFATEVTHNPALYINQKVLYKLQYGIPDPQLVQTYLIEIAKAHRVQWEPLGPVAGGGHVAVPSAISLAELDAASAAAPLPIEPPPYAAPAALASSATLAQLRIVEVVGSAPPLAPDATSGAPADAAETPPVKTGKDVECTPSAPALPLVPSPAPSAPPTSKANIDDELSKRLAALKAP